MSMYESVLFFHVASAVTLFAVLAIEWVSLRGLSASRTYEQARDWSGLWKLLMRIGLPATLVVLASGIYIATVGGMWRFGWVAVALPTYVGIIAAGGLVGPRRNRLQSALAGGTNLLPSELRRHLRHPLFRASWRMRAALLVGILFLMVVKPPQGQWVVGAFVLLGALGSVLAWMAGRQSQREQAQ